MADETMKLLPKINGITISVSNPGDTNIDATGFTNVDYQPAFTVSGCVFNPGVSSSEFDSTHNHLLTKQPIIYVPPDAHIEAGAKIQILDSTYQVDGNPKYWVNPFDGSLVGIEVQLKEMEG